MKRLCIHAVREGRQCRAHAMDDSKFCFFHDPEFAVQRTAARRAGGLTNKAAGVVQRPAEDLVLAGVSDVITLLGDTINRTRIGQLDPRVANSIGYISGILLKALEMKPLEERIAALEIAVKSRFQSPSVLNAEEFQFVQEVHQ